MGDRESLGVFWAGRCRVEVIYNVDLVIACRTVKRKGDGFATVYSMLIYVGYYAMPPKGL